MRSEDAPRYSAQNRSAPAVALDEEDTLRRAEAILAARFERQGVISDARSAGQFLRMRLGGLPHEEFHAIWLDKRHRVLACDMLFRGSIDGAEVSPRTVAQAALRRNAAAVIFAHNHPSGNTEPSRADARVTRQLEAVLELIEVQVLDHLIVGDGPCHSMAHQLGLQRLPQK